MDHGQETTARRVAVVGTGGTISAIGRDPFDLYDYDANETMLDAGELLSALPRADGDPESYAVPFLSVSSPRIGFPEWRGLCLLCDEIVKRDAGVAGIVIAHGTATLEETAFFLHMVAKVDVPIVIVGAQRPWNGLSSDGALNLRNAIRVAACPDARGLGVLVVLNDEIHSARDVTKASTMRLNGFQSPVHGLIGQADPDRIAIYRRPVRRHAPQADFDVSGLAELPRVDILYAYAGGDDVMARAVLAAGAQGIVSAGFAPGLMSAAETEALRDAVQAGVVVVQSTRAGTGRVPPASHLARAGFVCADDLTPQKARILLALALTITRDPREIGRIFQTH